MNKNLKNTLITAAMMAISLAAGSAFAGPYCENLPYSCPGAMCAATELVCNMEREDEKSQRRYQQNQAQARAQASQILQVEAEAKERSNTASTKAASDAEYEKAVYLQKKADKNSNCTESEYAVKVTEITGEKNARLVQTLNFMNGEITLINMSAADIRIKKVKVGRAFCLALYPLN